MRQTHPHVPRQLLASLALFALCIQPAMASAAPKKTPSWIQKLVESWRQDWVASAKKRHVNALSKHYHPEFKHLDAKLDRAGYMKRLAKGAKKHAWWKVEIKRIKVLVQSPSKLHLQLHQLYSRPGYSDVGTKSLIFRKHAGKWKIYREWWRAYLFDTKPKRRTLSRAQCLKVLKQKATTEPALRTYLSLPKKYLTIKEDRVIRFRKGKTNAQRLRWLQRCGIQKGRCWRSIAPQQGVMSLGNCDMGGGTLSYFPGTPAATVVYRWLPTMASEYTFLSRKGKGWKEHKAPQPSARMKRWMKKLSPYPNNGCPYGPIGYRKSAKGDLLEMYTWAGCNSDPPPHVWLASYRWSAGTWKLVKKRKRKPRFKQVGDGWKVVD